MTIVTFGESLGVFRPTTTGRLERGDNFLLSFGGAESNVAIGLSRLAVPVRWLGRVGPDPLGDMILRELRKEGVDVRAVVDESPTAMMAKEQRIPSSTRVSYGRTGSAGSRLGASDLDVLQIPDAELLHVTGITAALSHRARSAILDGISIAHRANVPVSFDVNHRRALWANDAEAAAVYREIAARSTILFAGLDEARLLAGTDDSPEQVGRALLSVGPSLVVIKLGANGAMAMTVDGTFSVDAIPITPIDTVGAGDAFVVGFLAERHGGGTIPQALDLAVRTGAFACLSSGDWEGAPTRRDLLLLGAEDPVLR